MLRVSGYLVGVIDGRWTCRMGARYSWALDHEDGRREEVPYKNTERVWLGAGLGQGA